MRSSPSGLLSDYKTGIKEIMRRKAMKQISFRNTNITGGFWKSRQEAVSKVSVYNILKRFTETGRFDAMDCKWKEGEPNEPHIFWDSDIAKWIESVAYIIEKEPHPDLEKIVDEVADKMEQNRMEDGYFNCCYIVKKPDERWTDRTDHELYCAGHLTEAAVAYYKATGKRKLLDVMEKYLDYIYDVFVTEKSASFITPGHEEIELALIKLYDLTGNEKYLDMCRFFIDNRGASDEQEYNGVAHKYSQSHLPVREQTTAEGHSVRAAYLYSGMADLAKKTGDKELFKAAETIFDDIVNRKMYITGGIGSTARGEAFTIPYDLPNLTAYSESCAALALAWFAGRMTLLDMDSKYADTVERVLYNNGLSSISLDGKSFFYVNPLEIRTELLERNTSQCDTHENLPITQRKEVFDCSCCPPNITRFIASVADFLYTADENTVYVHQYMNSETKTDEFSVSQKTGYPNDGRIEITSENINRIALRIPSWCRNYTATLNGKTADVEMIKGYAYIDLDGKENKIVLDFDIQPFVVYPSSNVRDCIGRAAVQRGPVVYCAEGVDNDFSVMTFRLSAEPDFKTEYSEQFGAYMIKANGTVPVISEKLYSFEPEKRVNAEIQLIPYYAFANRGETDMEVYLLY